MMVTDNIFGIHVICRTCSSEVTRMRNDQRDQWCSECRTMQWCLSTEDRDALYAVFVLGGVDAVQRAIDSWNVRDERLLGGAW